METRDNFDINGFDQCALVLGIERTMCLSYALQVNTKVPCSTMKVMADYSDNHYNEVIDDEMLCKWGIGLEKAKADLDVTKHMNVRSDILPLTERYRIYLLYHKLSRSSFRLYTDTLFADDTSMWGKTISQLYADGDGFVHLFPMSSKVGEVESMGNVVNDIGIINEIRCGNAL